MNIVKELRSNQAGETGAVWIYRAMNLFTKDIAMQIIIDEHLKQEMEHLRQVNQLLNKKYHSKLLSLWAIAGFITGFIPSIMGPNWMLRTIDAVETFVDQHYLEQIEFLYRNSPNLNRINVGNKQELIDILSQLRLDEIRHKQEALELSYEKPNFALKLWCSLVEFGSKNAVVLARKI